MAQKAIEQLEERIEELKSLSSESDIDLSDEIVRLEAKLKQMRREKPQVRESGSGSDDDWARVKLARHPKRPYTRDYIDAITDDFYELRGDRLYGEDRAIIGGMARFQGQTVVVVGHQKGRTTQENQRRNFGMAHPEGYRKVLRILKLAERFGFPVFSFIDTPGAYPGAGAEERNIGGALAINIYEMFTIRVPIIVTVIGEGGSGGAIGIGVGDRVLMLENAIYSVISPEGCASILWRDPQKAPQAAEALKLTPSHLLQLGVIDEVVSEPKGGAHTAPEQTAARLKEALARHLGELQRIDLDTLLQMRHEKFQAIGIYETLEEIVEVKAKANRSNRGNNRGGDG